VEEKQELLGRFPLGDVAKHCVVNNNVNGCFLCARLMLYFLQFNLESDCEFGDISQDLLRYAMRLKGYETTYRLYTLCTASMVLRLIRSSANICQVIDLLSHKAFNEKLVVGAMFEFKKTLLRDECMKKLLVFSKAKGSVKRDGKGNTRIINDSLVYMPQIICVTSLLQGWMFVCQTLQCNRAKDRMMILNSFCVAFSRCVYKETNVLRRLVFLKSLFRLLNFLQGTASKQVLESHVVYKKACGLLQKYMVQVFGSGSSSGWMQVLRLNNFQILSKMNIKDVVSQVYMDFDLHMHYLSI
jgi:hypothetical protein